MKLFTPFFVLNLCSAVLFAQSPKDSRDRGFVRQQGTKDVFDLVRHDGTIVEDKTPAIYAMAIVSAELSGPDSEFSTGDLSEEKLAKEHQRRLQLIDTHASSKPHLRGLFYTFLIDVATIEKFDIIASYFDLPEASLAKQKQRSKELLAKTAKLLELAPAYVSTEFSRAQADIVDDIRIIESRKEEDENTHPILAEMGSFEKAVDAKGVPIEVNEDSYVAVLTDFVQTQKALELLVAAETLADSDPAISPEDLAAVNFVKKHRPTSGEGLVLASGEILVSTSNAETREDKLQKLVVSRLGAWSGFPAFRSLLRAERNLERPYTKKYYQLLETLAADKSSDPDVLRAIFEKAQDGLLEAFDKDNEFIEMFEKTSAERRELNLTFKKLMKQSGENLGLADGYWRNEYAKADYIERKSAP